MPELSKLVIEIDSHNVLRATGDLEIFAKMGQKAGQSTDDMAKKMAAFQLIANKLPGPLNSIAAGLMGMVNPSTAVVGALISIGEAAVKYIGEAINLYAEHEAQLVRLGAVLKATGAETWTTTSALTKYANELQSTTGKSADEITRMQSVLLGFQSITGENFDRLTKNMLDMVDVMGGDMVSAANTFGKAMDNPAESLGALSRYGFKFTEQEKQMVKAMQEAGDLAGAQVIILKSQEKAFGGAAEAHLKTIQGMKEYVKTLKEQHKALQAEYSGMSDIAKEYYERQIQYYTEMNENMSRHIELQEIAEKKKSGTATVEDQYREIEIEVKRIEAAIKRAESGTGRYAAAEAMLLTKYEKQLEVQKAILDIYKPLMDYEKQRLAMIEKQAETLNRVRASYAGAMEFVNGIYEQTTEGQIEKLKEQINRLEIIRDNQIKVEKGRKYNSSTKLWEEVDVKNYLGQEEITKVIKDIDFLNEKLKNLKKTGNPFEDWVKVLAQATGYTEEIVNSWAGLGDNRGLKTINNFSEEINKVRGRMFAKDGYSPIYEFLGLGKVDVYEEAEQKMRDVVEAMTRARIENPWSVSDEDYQRAIQLLKEYKELTSTVRRIENYNEDKSDLDKRKELIWATKEELRLNELAERYVSDQRAKEIYALEQQIEKVEALRDALNQLKEAGLQLAASGLVDFAHDLGKAYQDGSISLSETENAFRNMLKSMIDAMPQMLLNVGLQLMSKNWKLGLAFIGASGLMSFVSGLTDAAEQDGRNDEAERLRRIQEQITDLIDAQRKQQEYYLVQKRKVNDSALRVNDAIITPRGTVYTHPDDYIIATKTPETLMSGKGGGNVYISIQNNAPVTVNTESETTEDGARKVKITIDNIVKNGIANGDYDGAFNAMNNRNRGRRISN